MEIAALGAVALACSLWRSANPRKVSLPEAIVALERRNVEGHWTCPRDVLCHEHLDCGGRCQPRGIRDRHEPNVIGACWDLMHLVRERHCPGKRLDIGVDPRAVHSNRVDSFQSLHKIDSPTETQSEVQLTFEGDFNAMMAMMIKAPITKFIETLALNIPKKI